MFSEARRTNEKQGVARAKILWSSELSWSVGFPLRQLDAPEVPPSTRSDTLPWLVCRGSGNTHSGKILKLDRESLRRSELAASRLRHQSPSILRRIFTDPDKWFENFNFLLQAIKLYIHWGDTKALDQDRWLDALGLNSVTSLVDGQTSQIQLQSLLDDVRIAEQFIPQETRLPIDQWLVSMADCWSHDNRPCHTAKNVDHPFSLQQQEWLLFCQLRQSLRDPSCLQDLTGMLRCLTENPLLVPHPDKQLNTELKRFDSFLEGEEAPVDKRPPQQLLYRSFIDTLGTAIQAKPARQSAILEAVASVCCPHRASQLRGTHLFLEERTNELARLQKKAQALSRQDDADLWSALYSALQEWKARPLDPRQYDGSNNLHHFLSQIARDDIPLELLHMLHDFFSTFTDNSDQALAFIVRLLQTVLDQKTTHTASWKRTCQILSGLEKLADNTANPSQVLSYVFRPATETQREFSIFDFGNFNRWRRKIRDCEEGGQFPTATDVRLVQRAFVIIEQLVLASIKIDSLYVLDLIVEFSDSQVPPTAIALILQELEAQSEPIYPDREKLDVIYQFNQEPRRLAWLLKRIEDLEISSTTFAALSPLARDELGRDCVLASVARASGKQLRILADLIGLYPETEIGVPLAPSTDQHEWISNYPQQLWNSLQMLASVSDRAETLAEQILAGNFVEREKRLQELAYLQRQLAEDMTADRRSALESRCASLEQQLTQQRLLSDKRLENLNGKLLCRARLENERRLRALFVGQLLEELPKEVHALAEIRLEEEDFLRVLIGIARLTARDKEWGMELIRCSLLGRPFPELEYEANRTFQQRLEVQGVNFEPWMDSRWLTRCQADGMEEVRLEFATDPYQYLLMGHHFDTCLSPGECNFYSTISNAIDINKRVVYAYDSAGRVIGRCLIALSETGQLVRYNLYSHCRHTRFQQAMEKFLEELAEQMHVRCVSEAIIPRIVSDHWYDDGPVQVSQEITPGSVTNFRKLLVGLSAVTKPSRQNEQQLTQALAETIICEGVWLTLGQLEDDTPEWIDCFIYEALAKAGEKHATRMFFAQVMFKKGRLRIFQRVIGDFSKRELEELFRCNFRQYRRWACYFDFPDADFLQAVIDLLPATLALRCVRIGRRRGVRADSEETCSQRRRMLASIHRRLQRERLALQLQPVEAESIS